MTLVTGAHMALCQWSELGNRKRHACYRAQASPATWLVYFWHGAHLLSDLCLSIACLLKMVPDSLLRREWERGQGAHRKSVSENAVRQRGGYEPRRQGMGYGTRLHDWELDELGSVKSSVSVSVSLCRLWKLPDPTPTGKRFRRQRVTSFATRMTVATSLAVPKLAGLYFQPIDWHGQNLAPATFR